MLKSRARPLSAQFYEQLASAVLGPGGRAYPQMDIDTAPRPKPSRIEAAPHGPTLGDFFIDSTMDQTFRGY